jgi:hypothetical protein
MPKDAMISDFIGQPLQRQIILDVLLPPPFVFFCWMCSKVKAFVFGKRYGWSLQTCAWALGGAYILMVLLTMYSQVVR